METERATRPKQFSVELVYGSESGMPACHLDNQILRTLKRNGPAGSGFSLLIRERDMTFIFNSKKTASSAIKKLKTKFGQKIKIGKVMPTWIKEEEK